MDIGGPLVFRILNFSILAYLLFRVMRKAMRHFFFARRISIRKGMLETVIALKSARARAARSREIYERLPEDIAARKNAVAKRALLECKEVRDEARAVAQHIVEETKRLAAEERAKAVDEARQSLLDGAFFLARKEILQAADSAAGAICAERGLRDFKKACKCM